MSDSAVVSVYADGGVVGRNPSPKGGTWAYLHLDAGGNMVANRCGVVTPERDGAGLATISNNFTELWAALLGLEALPDGWAGTLYTDSEVTRGRLVNARPSFTNIPECVQERVVRVKARLGPFTAVLLSGHPTQEQLARGTGKGGRPVSRWNVLCDQICTRLAAKFAAGA